MDSFNKNRSGTGTREWSEISYNIGLGCSNDCVYCFARAGAMHYKTIKEAGEWPIEKVDAVKAAKKYPNRNGKTIMFPTTHDITPAYLNAAIVAIGNILKAGNTSLLIVSKPRLDCITALCDAFGDHKDHILFRFSIGTTDARLARVLEPGAPVPAERIAALELAMNRGFKTSISMEPFFGGVEGAIATFRAVEPFVTNDIWIGKMNRISDRVKVRSSEVEEAIRVINAEYADDNIRKLVAVLGSEPKVAWKDSIKKVMGWE